MAWNNRQQVESPLAEWPGYIVVPKELTPEQFSGWWERSRRLDEEEDGERPAEFKMFEERGPLVLEWHIEGVNGEAIAADGGNLPSMKLIGFVIAATQPLVIEARSLPKLRGPSKDGTRSTETS